MILVNFADVDVLQLGVETPGEGSPMFVCSSIMMEKKAETCL